MWKNLVSSEVTLTREDILDMGIPKIKLGSRHQGPIRKSLRPSSEFLLLYFQNNSHDPVHKKLYVHHNAIICKSWNDPTRDWSTQFVDSVLLDKNCWFYSNRESTFWTADDILEIHVPTLLIRNNKMGHRINKMGIHFNKVGHRNSKGGHRNNKVGV